MDAVYADADYGWTVVDWKTGALPDPARRVAVNVQLAAYRLAWAALAGVLAVARAGGVPLRTPGRDAASRRPARRGRPARAAGRVPV